MNEVVRMVGTDVRAKLAKFFTPSRVDRILQLVSRGKTDKLLSDVLDAAGKSDNYDMPSMSYYFGILTFADIILQLSTL